MRYHRHREPTAKSERYVRHQVFRSAIPRVSKYEVCALIRQNTDEAYLYVCTVADHGDDETENTEVMAEMAGASCSHPISLHLLMDSESSPEIERRSAYANLT